MESLSIFTRFKGWMIAIVKIIENLLMLFSKILSEEIFRSWLEVEPPIRRLICFTNKWWTILVKRILMTMTVFLLHRNNLKQVLHKRQIAKEQSMRFWRCRNLTSQPQNIWDQLLLIYLVQSRLQHLRLKQTRIIIKEVNSNSSSSQITELNTEAKDKEEPASMELIEVVIYAVQNLKWCRMAWTIRDSKTTEIFMAHRTSRISRMRRQAASRITAFKIRVRTFLMIICSKTSLISSRHWLRTITPSMTKAYLITSKTIISHQPCKLAVTSRQMMLDRLHRAQCQWEYQILRDHHSSKLARQARFIYWIHLIIVDQSQHIIRFQLHNNKIVLLRQLPWKVIMVSMVIWWWIQISINSREMLQVVVLSRCNKIIQEIEMIERWWMKVS